MFALVTYVVYWLRVRCVTFVYYVGVLVVAIYLTVCLYVCWLVFCLWLMLLGTAWLYVCMVVFTCCFVFDDGLYLMLVVCCLISFG